ncbi:MAG: SMP-30/gluconolactonase/LRE family protein [Actinomycetia bacterium]|nr:SMP-30/gluconolactonase/LRE family protein [Actinomycetes bacterium]
MPKPKIAPQRWQPPKDRGLVGAFQQNAALADVSVIPIPGNGPEDIAVSADGWVYTGVTQGGLWRTRVEGGPVEFVAETRGRPLGIEVHPDGDLIVCDADMGLLRVNPATKKVSVLVQQILGRKPLFINNCCVAADGSIYFTDSSTTTGVHHFKADLLEHGRSGRLLRWRPDGTTEVLLDGLSFANGVALDESGDFLIFAETGAYRVSRFWLTGPSAGAHEVVLENLPGLPDNISTGSDGVFWVALPSYRNALLDTLLPKPGWIRKAIWALPEAVQPEATRCTFVLGITADGQVRHNLQADGSRYHYVTGVREAAGSLWLGSLVENAIARVPWPQPTL